MELLIKQLKAEPLWLMSWQSLKSECASASLSTLTSSNQINSALLTLEIFSFSCLFVMMQLNDTHGHSWNKSIFVFFHEGINEPPIYLCLVFLCLDTSRVIFLITILSTISFLLLQIFPPLLALWLPQHWEKWTPGSHCHSYYLLPSFTWKSPQYGSHFSYQTETTHRTVVRKYNTSLNTCLSSVHYMHGDRPLLST